MFQLLVRHAFFYSEARLQPVLTVCITVSNMKYVILQLHFCLYSITYLPTPWSRDLTEKLTGPQQVTAFYGSQSSLPHSRQPATYLYPEPDQTSPCPHQPTSQRSVLILSSHLCLGLPSALLPLGVPTKTLYAPLVSPYMLKALPISVVPLPCYI